MICSPVAGLRPVCALRTGLTRTVNWTRPPMQSSELTIASAAGPRPGGATASATFRVLAKDDLDVDAALASAVGCLPTDEVAAAAPATALSPEGPCCARLRRCPDCSRAVAATGLTTSKS